MGDGGDELEVPADLRGFGNVLLWLIAIRAPGLVDRIYRAGRARRSGVYGTVDDHYVPSPPVIAWLLAAERCGIPPASPKRPDENSAKTMNSMRTSVNRAFNGQPNEFLPEWFEWIARLCRLTASDLALAKRSREQLFDNSGRTVDPATLRKAIEITRRSHPAEEEPPAGVPPARPAAHGRPAIPRQLPMAVTLAGRTAEVARLDDLIADGDPAVATIVISAITGTGGVGKTALAVAWAHRAADWFPDGQLYADLRGFSPAGPAADPGDVIRGFLEALDVTSATMPKDLDAQAALYRSLLAERRILVILDNARDTEQVRPLLPGTPHSLALVTSRNRLPGLVADGAIAIPLDVLTLEEARELLSLRLGAQRVAADPLAIDRIITSCARLPLALAITAALAADHPDFPLAAFARDSPDAAGQLDDLAIEPAADLRRIFSWSYAALPEAAARMFRLLGVHPGPDISEPAAASLAGVPWPQARNALATLTQANLIHEQLPGRYSFHDLLRAYARGLAGADDLAAEHGEAISRSSDHYLHSVWAASLVTDKFQRLPALAPPAPGVTAETFTDSQQALEWFQAERSVLMAAVSQAVEASLHACVWQLAWGLATFLYRQGHWQDMDLVMRSAIASTNELRDKKAAGIILNFLAQAHIQAGKYEDASAELEQVLSLFNEPGKERQRAVIHVSFALIHERQGNHGEALGHALDALKLSRAARDHESVAVALNSVGWYHALLGNFDEAVRYCKRSLALFTALNDKQGQADALLSLGYAYSHLGQHGLAIDYLRRALALYHGLDVRFSEADTLDHLGDACFSSGNLPDTREAWTSALAIYTELGHPKAEEVRNKLAGLLCIARDYERRSGRRTRLV
jgi:tetratricopeptide (TPR) repeat protein